MAPEITTVVNSCALSSGMMMIQEIQMTLRDEIKSMCEYRPYENNDYAARTATEISVRKLDSVLGQLTNMQEIADEYHGIRSRSG